MRAAKIIPYNNYHTHLPSPPGAPVSLASGCGSQKGTPLLAFSAWCFLRNEARDPHAKRHVITHARVSKPCHTREFCLFG